MGTTGIIFGAIAVAWLIYLVPMFVRRDDAPEVDEEDPANRFSDSIRIIRQGMAPLLDQDLAEIPSVEVSTPLTRRAAIADLRRLERLAARRRLRMLVLLMTITSAVVSVCAFGLIPWWSVAIPGGLLVGFVVVARISVRGMRRDLDARFQSIRRGSDENTIFLSPKHQRTPDEKTGSLALGETAQPGKPGGLWDPVPITMPTYVSKPLAPRTVRTIDLSSPDVTSSGRQSVPVTADAPTTKKKAKETDGDTDRRAASA
ncbi:divisome protein SepX/GlpR [Microlunatus parietis]|uniref:Uncharacterized protein n=1 Tax=Microlunatus parietis TaxID=682979 RepID=A0A7Y9LB96_9ACTN|nr:hypothetical protein [Microlunatus parietis]NYE70603.1 hypothetical protein [Microlunatus parietis]